MVNTSRDKGKSIILFPDEYIVVDIETTGLDTEFNDIIEIGAIHVKDGQEIDSFSELIKPPCGYVDSFITALTGITNEMLKDAPSEEEVLPSFLKFVGHHNIIGHNVNFDINFLYDAIYAHFNKKLQNDFVDTMRISRKLHPDWKHNRLSDLSGYYCVDCSNAHRALRDCRITNECFTALHKEVLDTYDNEEQFYDLFKKKYKYHYHKNISAKDIVPTTDDFDVDHPLYGKVCVFTGALEKMERKDAMQLVVNCGGIVGDGVTKKTNYLILGNFDYSNIKDGKSSKLKKAEKYKLEGQDIDILSENVFYDIVLV